MTTIRLQSLDENASLVLPAELAAKLGVQPGDQLAVVETDRGIEICGRLSDADVQFEVAKQIMEEDKQVLRKLAE